MKNQIDIVTKYENKMKNFLPNETLDIIKKFTESLYPSNEGQLSVMKKLISKIFDSKKYKGKKSRLRTIKEKQYLKWETNPQLVKGMNNKINYWLNTAYTENNKSWSGYFYMCINNYFTNYVESSLFYNTPEPPKHNKNKQTNNGRHNNRKHIQEKNQNGLNMITNMKNILIIKIQKYKD